MFHIWITLFSAIVLVLSYVSCCIATSYDRKPLYLALIVVLRLIPLVLTMLLSV